MAHLCVPVPCLDSCATLRNEPPRLGCVVEPGNCQAIATPLKDMKEEGWCRLQGSNPQARKLYDINGLEGD